VYNIDRVNESMLRGEKGAWAARNLFGKILNGPPRAGKLTKRQTNRLWKLLSLLADLPGLPLSRAQPTRAGPLENLHLESVATVLPIALNSREHKTPFPSLVTDRPNELIYMMYI
jgi:hypothetical protein